MKLRINNVYNLQDIFLNPPRVVIQLDFERKFVERASGVCCDHLPKHTLLVRLRNVALGTRAGCWACRFCLLVFCSFLPSMCEDEFVRNVFDREDVKVFANISDRDVV